MIDWYYGRGFYREWWAKHDTLDERKLLTLLMRSQHGEREGGQVGTSLPAEGEDERYRLPWAAERHAILQTS